MKQLDFFVQDTKYKHISDSNLLTAKIVELVNALGATTKGTEKLQILKSNKDFTEFWVLADIVTNPMIQFHLRALPLIHNYDICTTNIADFGTLLKNLATRVVTGNNAHNALDEFWKNSNVNMQTILKYCIDKDLKCGVSRKTLCKVKPELNTTVKLMKATGYSEKALQKIKFPAVSQLKADGARVLLFVPKDGAPYGLSPKGTEFKLPEALIKALYKAQPKRCLSDVILDGEMLIQDSSGKFLPRKTGNGIVNKILKNTASVNEINSVVFVLWDIITFSEYEAGYSSGSDREYWGRFEHLEQAYWSTEKNSHLQIIPTKRVSNIQEAKEHFASEYAAGNEGTILKNIDAQWENKRSVNCVKFKSELVTTLKVVDIKPGKPGSKYENALGALLCQTDCGKLEVSVGSGLTDEQRNTIGQEIIGTYIDVKFNELLEADNGTYSLFLPRFEKERPDKQVSDTIADIQNMTLNII